MRKIAYCPTMQCYIDNATKNKEVGIEFIALSSAAQVLSQLQAGLVDGVIIGRRAKSFEINEDTNFLKFQDGVTLINKSKRGIDKNSLKAIDVLTYLSKEEVSTVETLFLSVEFRSSLEECLQDEKERPIIINWNDFSDELELLIPRTESGKMAEFRAPVLYYNNLNSDETSFLKKYIK